MSSKEKAKTFDEIRAWVFELPLECRPYDEKLHEDRMKTRWVMLEDAESHEEQMIGEERKNIVRKIQALLQDRIDKTKSTHIALRGITFEGVQEILRYIKDVELEEILKESEGAKNETNIVERSGVISQRH